MRDITPENVLAVAIVDQMEDEAAPAPLDYAKAADELRRQLVSDGFNSDRKADLEAVVAELEVRPTLPRGSR